MPSRNSTVPNLDLSAVKSNNGKLSHPLSAGAQNSGGLSPMSGGSNKSHSSFALFKGPSTIRPVTQDSNLSTTSPTSPSSPVSPNHSDTEISAEPITPGITAIPQFFPSPKDSGKHGRDVSKSFFGNLKASKAPKSSHRQNRSDSSENSADYSKSWGGSRDRRLSMAPKLSESTPDLPGKIARATEYENDRKSPSKNHSEQKAVHAEPESAPAKKNKRFANLLTRTRSIRVDDSAKNRTVNRRPSTGLARLEEFNQDQPQTPTVKQSTKPSRPTRLQRPTERPTEPIPIPVPTRNEPKSHGGSMASITPSNSFSQVSGASTTITNYLKLSSSGAADRLGKAGKGFFGKITRSGSTGEREIVSDDTYVCHVINLPLIKQARKTRIAKKLEDCRDKTEFWMPALPYRCIDYLNFKGCEEEGLYRVPGSGREVKHWQRRFDTEYDISLFDVPDLYDINTVGSLFKAWLRELPEELFPKSTQDMIAEQCEGATTAPQLLKDELSKLPPYNYYLLFAITCHLNLLHSYVDQNKMDYRNLCICFQPCMRIDAFCFWFLVCDWKNCWQGCWTEKEYMAKEQEMNDEEEKNKSKPAGDSPPKLEIILNSSSHERAISDGSSSHAEEEQQRPRPQTSGGRKTRPKNIETRPTHSRSISQLPELGPPLSPIKI